MQLAFFLSCDYFVVVSRLGLVGALENVPSPSGYNMRSNIMEFS